MKINKIFILLLGLSFLTSSASQVVDLTPAGHYKDLGISQDGYERFSLADTYTEFYCIEPTSKNPCQDSRKCWSCTQEEILSDILGDIIKKRANDYNVFDEMDPIIDGCKRFRIITGGWGLPPSQYLVAPDGRYWIVNRIFSSGLCVMPKPEDEEERNIFIAKEKERFDLIINMLRTEK